MVEQCMSEYDLDGWTGDTWVHEGGNRQQATGDRR
jgi:hypothetical protein